MDSPHAVVDGQSSYPRLVENVWHVYPDGKSAVLITSRARFEVDRDDALKFLRMRSYCTGQNSAEEIASRSGLTAEEVCSILDSLREAGVVLPHLEPPQQPIPSQVREVLLKICSIWAEELRAAYIGNELDQGHLSKTVLMGWLVEMYHYIRDFPRAIEHGAVRASGRLKEVLLNYASQEKGHEVFVLRTLVNLGVKREEVENSTPLVSTRTIALLMRELFELEPSATLMMAALVEAQELNEDGVRNFGSRMNELYGVASDSFEPFFEHQRIDVSMGHSELLSQHAELVKLTDTNQLDRVVNMLHDLKHAFELQSLEIKSYYGTLEGKYFPRQAMLYNAL